MVTVQAGKSRATRASSSAVSPAASGRAAGDRQSPLGFADTQLPDVLPPDAKPKKVRKPASKTSDEPLPTPFTILVDQQEGAPWRFTDLRADADKKYRPWVVQQRICHLKTGDYSIEGLEHLLTCERKSKEDLFGSVSGGHERFRREHERMREMIRAGGQAVVIIECSLEDAMENPPLWSSTPPKVVRGTWLSWRTKYGVEWIWAGSRRWAEVAAFDLLRKFWEEREGREKLFR